MFFVFFFLFIAVYQTNKLLFIVIIEHIVSHYQKFSNITSLSLVFRIVDIHVQQINTLIIVIGWQLSAFERCVSHKRPRFLSNQITFKCCGWKLSGPATSSDRKLLSHLSFFRSSGLICQNSFGLSVSQNHSGTLYVSFSAILEKFCFSNLYEKFWTRYVRSKITR